MAQIQKSGNVEEEYYREQDRLNIEIILVVEAVIIAFLPFLLPLPLLTFYIWHRDIQDLSGDWKRKIDKERLWTLLFLLISFFVFYFYVFPYIPPNPFPMWSVYPAIAPHFSLLINTILFSISVVATAYLTFKAHEYCKKKCNPLLKYIDKDILIIPTQTHGTLFLDNINTGIMVLGSPKGGKTELIKQFFMQLPKDDDYAWIIFDPKGDYIEEFATDKDIILAIDGGTHAWNLFWEVPLDPDNTETLREADADIHEIAAGLLSEESWQQDKFWIQTARELFYGVMYMKIREAWENYWLAKESYRKLVDEAKRNGEETPPMPDILKDIKNTLPPNFELATYLRSTSMEDMYADLSKYEKLKSIAEYVNPEAEKMAMSIHATLSSEVEKIFIGSFGSSKSGKLPQMSIREYMENPRGRKLFIKYDVERGAVLGSIYKVIIERAIKFALKNENKYTKDGKLKRKFFIIDEFQNIPPVKNYQQLVNFGRSLGCTSIIGIQSLAQVDEKYKQEGTNSIVAGHGIVVAFHGYDARTSQFIMERLGKFGFWTQRPLQVQSLHGGGSATIGRELQRIESMPLEEREMRYWKAGEGILITQHGWKKIRIYPYSSIIDEDTGKRVEGGKDIIMRTRKEMWRLKLRMKIEGKKGKKPTMKKLKKTKLPSKGKKEMNVELKPMVATAINNPSTSSTNPSPNKEEIKSPPSSPPTSSE